MTHIFDEFKWRGLVFDHTEGVPEVLAKEKISTYIGFDPTADSLHIGNLVGMLWLARMQRAGHTPISLAGGGTGMIGDPGGKSAERNLLPLELIEANVAKIKVQLASVLDFDVKSNPARVVNNVDWLSQLSMMAFLRDVGKHFTVNYMMAKDSVKSRLDREGSGISYTEFSYMLLQAYDFQYLFENHNVVLQAGGSDQYGNITAGVALIRRRLGKRAYGFVYPLITKADGTKFGKTETGTVWLSPERTSPYRFYQFWFNADDADVVRFLKVFTFLGQAEIGALAHEVETAPHQRAAQRKLAQIMTGMLHGETAVLKAEKAAQVLFGGEIDGLNATDMKEIFADVPSSEFAKADLEGEGSTAVSLLVSSGLAASKGDARRAIQGGGIYVNNIRVTDVGQLVTVNDAVAGEYLVLRKGRKKYHLIQAK